MHVYVHAIDVYVYQHLFSSAMTKSLLAASTVQYASGNMVYCCNMVVAHSLPSVFCVYPLKNAKLGSRKERFYILTSCFSSSSSSSCFALGSAT